MSYTEPGYCPECKNPTSLCVCDQRPLRPIVEEFRSEFDNCTFFGEPIGDLTNDELKAALCMAVKEMKSMSMHHADDMKFLTDVSTRKPKVSGEWSASEVQKFSEVKAVKESK